MLLAHLIVSGNLRESLPFGRYKKTFRDAREVRSALAGKGVFSPSLANRLHVAVFTRYINVIKAERRRDICYILNLKIYIARVSKYISIERFIARQLRER